LERETPIANPSAHSSRDADSSFPIPRRQEKGYRAISFAIPPHGHPSRIRVLKCLVPPVRRCAEEIDGRISSHHQIQRFGSPPSSEIVNRLVPLELFQIKRRPSALHISSLGSSFGVTIGFGSPPLAATVMIVRCWLSGAPTAR
jgi:hypothetical protein